MVSSRMAPYSDEFADKYRKKSGTRREKEIQSMARASLDALVMINAEGVVDFWNPAAERLFGYSEKEAMGRCLHTLLAAPKDQHLALEKMPEFSRTGKGPVIDTVHELQARCRDGTLVDVELSVAAFELEGKWHAVGVLRDVTEKKKTREALGNALHKAEEASRQLSMELVSLSELQQSVLPAMAHTSRYVSARGLFQPSGLAAGDYFDYLPSPGGGLRCIVADASGHGARAAFIMSMVRTLFHLDENQNRPLSVMVEQLNRQLLQTVGKQGDFVTLATMDISPEADCIQYINAGHCPGFFRDEGGMTEIAATGPLLGVTGGDYPHQELTCSGEWEILLYTDGFYECRERDGDIFGYDLFKDLCFSLMGRGVLDVDRLPREVAASASGIVGFEDDLTALHVTGRPEPVAKRL